MATQDIKTALQGQMTEEQIEVLLTDPHLEDNIDEDDDEVFIPEGDEYF